MGMMSWLKGSKPRKNKNRYAKSKPRKLYTLRTKYPDGMVRTEKLLNKAELEARKRYHKRTSGRGVTFKTTSRKYPKKYIKRVRESSLDSHGIGEVD